MRCTVYFKTNLYLFLLIANYHWFLVIGFFRIEYYKAKRKNYSRIDIVLVFLTV
ncbi:uncharacterized protein B0P05DRAFT_521998, partial [Gilbertella persicaria]|uniref:uncharacterized protein n=1 Tax=Gilbertella persicaria TaxID=101096 RepID=UPI0022208004